MGHRRGHHRTVNGKRVWVADHDVATPAGAVATADPALAAHVGDGGTSGDPFADQPAAPTRPAAWIADLDAHNDAAYARQRAAIADAETAVAHADAAVADADARVRDIGQRIFDAQQRGDEITASKRFYAARNELTDVVRDHARDTGALDRWAARAAEQGLAHRDPKTAPFDLAKSLAGDHQNMFDGLNSDGPNAFARAWDPDDWADVSARVNADPRTDQIVRDLTLSSDDARAARAHVMRLRESGERAEQGARDAKSARQAARTHADNAKARLRAMQGHANRGLPADSHAVSTNDKRLADLAVAEPDGGTNVYVPDRRGGHRRVMAFDRSANGHRVAVLDDGTRHSTSTHSTYRQTFGGTGTVVVTPPRPGSRPADDAGSIHGSVFREHWD